MSTGGGLEDLRNERVRKLERLKELGINPYPAKTNRTHTLKEVSEQFGSLGESGEVVTVAGRVMVRRGQGQIMFTDFRDGTGSFQAVLKGDVLDAEKLSLFEEVVDGGDFVEFTGTLFTTEKGQASLLVSDWRMLTKSLLPLPDKRHGLKDEDERYRKRYLDILTNDDLKEVFVRKSKFWNATRTFMVNEGFLEVETPTLEVTTGGAEARPFKTHHNDFDIDVFLRISIGELWQKRLAGAGFSKTFEIGRAYRNEGTSPEHLQEFTNMEFYWAYAHYRDGMDFVRRLYIHIAQEVYGTTEFTYKDHSFNLADEWREVDYVEEIQNKTGIAILEATEDDMKGKLQELGVSYEGDNRERLTDTLWKHCRKNIAGPAFLVNHPKLIAPLAKSREENEGETEMFQPLIAGSEVGRGYSELNDPMEQERRFNEQQELIDRGDDEAMMKDDEFVEMLEHGMPPTCGFGFGERLFAILEDKPLRETQLFPLMRPRS